MYNYAASASIPDGISNICVLSVATAFLAILIALYYNNFLKNERRERRLYSNAEREGEGDSGEIVKTAESEVEDDRYLHKELEMRLTAHEDDSDDDIEGANRLNNSLGQRTLAAHTPNSSDDDSEGTRAEGLVSKLKSKRLRELEAQLTRDQLEEERRIEREQLAAIFELLKKQEAELNMKEIDENELNAQLSLYR